LTNSGVRSAGVRRSIDPEKTTLAEYLPDWLRSAARGNNGASSFERYEQVMRLQIAPLLGAVTLSEINAADVRYLKQAHLDDGLAPNTVSYVQDVLSTALNQGVSDRLIPENLARLIKRARSRCQKMRTLDQEQAQSFIACVDGTPHRLFYPVAVRLCLSRGELLGHKYPAMTLRKYVHVLSEMQDDATSRMDKILS
jgi:Phage integrase, N-terminal SAM-like domain